MQSTDSPTLDSEGRKAGAQEPPAKRQRVSLACNHCRSARSRCDGARPSCDVCSYQGRQCSYTSPNRRRGTPTGYLHTVECSLAYLLEQNPENAKHLDRLLKLERGLLEGKPATSKQRLHKKWSNSRYRRVIWRMLADGDPTTSEDEDEGWPEVEDRKHDLLSEKAQANTPPVDGKEIATPGSLEPVRFRVQLPPNWQQLVDVYFVYTNCWLPILDKETLLNAAASFPADGLQEDQIYDVSPSHAELWAVLALASFQSGEAWQQNPIGGVSMSPKRIYGIARNMMPSEEKSFELPHLRALLLHSLVLMGQGAGLAAWMLIGTALRLALHLRESGKLAATMNEPTASAGTLALAATLILNTLASAYLGQPTFLSLDTDQVTAAIDQMALEEEAKDWDGTHAGVSPLRSFRQLYKIVQTLSASLRSGGQRSNMHEGGAAAKHIIGCLTPEFSFCNNVFGSLAPPVPSASVVHAVFLTALTQCVPGYRSSLVSNLREVVEECEARFGPFGVPPVIICLAGTALRSRHAEKMDLVERRKWERVAGSLRAVWTGRGNPSSQKIKCPPPVQGDYDSQSYVSASSLSMPTLLGTETDTVFEPDALNAREIFNSGGMGCDDVTTDLSFGQDSLLTDFGIRWPEGEDACVG